MHTLLTMPVSSFSVFEAAKMPKDLEFAVCADCKHLKCRCLKGYWWRLPASESGDGGGGAGHDNGRAHLLDPWPGLRSSADQYQQWTLGYACAIQSFLYDCFVYFL